MRVIKFRGKSLKTGEWVYGYYVARVLINGYVKHQIIGSHGRAYVDGSTVGQFADKYDVNHVGLYDGDIITVDNTVLTVTYNTMFNSFMTEGEITINRYGVGEWLTEFLCVSLGVKGFVIIGNIYDNTELTEPQSK